MFTDQHMFKNPRTDADLWVKCANGTLAKILGTGDVGGLGNVLSAPYLKTDLISEGN